jgi:hypothetical protein
MLIFKFIIDILLVIIIFSLIHITIIQKRIDKLRNKE